MTGYTFPQLIDFTRTSAATFVNSSGNIASTPQSRNLLTFTQEFDNAAWTATRASVTANSTTAPDGTSTADTLVEDSTASNSHRIQRIVNIPGSAITFSLYMKASGRNWAYLRIDDASTTRFAYFNLATGVVGTVNAGLTATITSVGNGWYRCVTTLAAPAATATGNVVFGSATADNSDSYTGTGIASIFIWGAQLEQASSATDYTRNFGGLFPPRFDYDPVTRAPRGLLIEEQRTNLLVRSEEFDNASWAKGNGTVTANATTSPDGTVDADSFVSAAATDATFVQQAFTSTAQAYAASVYVKANGVQFVQLLWASGQSTNHVNFDLTNGTIGTNTATSASITAVGNGWYRLTIVSTLAAASGAFNVYCVSASNSARGATFAGNGTSGIFIWGAQLEAGAFATSYIPTVASQVTRTADTATINAPNFASWYRPDEGTMVVEASSFVSTALLAVYASFALNNGTSTNQLYVFNYNNKWGAASTVGGVNQCDMQATGSYTANVPAKLAFAYKANDFAFSANGATALTDGSGTVPSGVTQATFGSGINNALNGHIRSIRYYPTRLTNAQLQALTA